MISNKLKRELYLEPDLISQYDFTRSGESDCCWQPVIDDLEICSKCYEHCEYRNAVCIGCGEEYPEWEKDNYCNNNCKKLSEI